MTKLHGFSRYSSYCSGHLSSGYSGQLSSGPVRSQALHELRSLHKPLLKAILNPDPALMPRYVDGPPPRLAPEVRANSGIEQRDRRDGYRTAYLIDSGTVEYRTAEPHGRGWMWNGGRVRF